MPTLLAEPTFLRLRADAWGAILTALLLGFAAFQLRHARRVKDDQTAEARARLDEQTRPYVIVDFHFRSALISLSVTNIGQTAASDVRIRLRDRVESAVMPDVAWQDSGLFVDRTAQFAPGREMRFVLDIFHERVAKGLPMSMSGTVEYWRFDRRGAKITEPFEIDLSCYNDSLLPPKDLSDLADEVGKIRELMKQEADRRAARGSSPAT